MQSWNLPAKAKFQLLETLKTPYPCFTELIIILKLVFKGGVLAIAILALAINTASAVKDDAFIAYLNGTNVNTLGIKTLDGVSVTLVSLCYMTIILFS